ncbi:MAG: terpene cyclase/mutase family protein [Planctomycetota bacterium]|nr:terpene cyclase/mutase family protein [Planctomycetota bacterium]
MVLLLGCSPLSTVEVEESKTSRDASKVAKPIPPPTPQAVDDAIERGVDFLLKVQNKNGSWGSAHNTKDLNIYAPVPGAHHAFRTAVSAMCLSALIEVDSDREDVLQSIQRGEQWMFAYLPRLRRANPVAIYNVWGHAYSVQALVRMYHRLPNDIGRREEIRTLLEQQIDLLDRYESVDGGWGYYDFRVGSKKPASSSTSFVTAAVLIGLREAEQMGVRAPPRILKRAIDSIHRQQKNDFTYLYGEYMKWRPMYSINRPGGSLGRSQACNAALRAWGDEKITDEVLKTWLNRLFDRHGWLDMGRKRPIPHESWFAVAGYFFYFGHYYAGLCIEQLPEADREKFQDKLAGVLLRLQEKDGSWWDYPLYNYHQQYGTAFSLMTLLRCRKPPAAPDPAN